MTLSLKQKEDIKVLLSKKIENKLKAYGRETTSMPFLARLIQDNEKIAAYSFIHSIATSLTREHFYHVGASDSISDAKVGTR
jgi:hypothetical protein